MNVDSLLLLTMSAEIRHSIQANVHIFRDDAADAEASRIWAKVSRAKALLREAAQEAAAFEASCLQSIETMEAGA